MTQYLISFDDGWMVFPEEELPAVAEAAQKVVQEARAAGVWVFGGGLESQRASVVATDRASVASSTGSRRNGSAPASASATVRRSSTSRSSTAVCARTGARCSASAG